MARETFLSREESSWNIREEENNGKRKNMMNITHLPFPFESLKLFLMVESKLTTVSDVVLNVWVGHI